MSSPYIFTSQRLGFRPWSQDDVPAMAAINADPEVMKYFPAIQTEEQTAEFVERMQKHYGVLRFCYFAVDRLDTKELIGFIGLLEKTFESDFTPCIDLGWRLGQKHWGQGFATEGAKKCIEFAFSVAGLEEVFAICPQVNLPSEAVMKKIGMRKIKSFQHPLLKDDERLNPCLLYSIKAGDATL